MYINKYIKNLEHVHNILVCTLEVHCTHLTNKKGAGPSAMIAYVRVVQ